MDRLLAGVAELPALDRLAHQALLSSMAVQGVSKAKRPAPCAASADLGARVAGLDALAGALNAEIEGEVFRTERQRQDARRGRGEHRGAFSAPLTTR